MSQIDLISVVIPTCRRGAETARSAVSSALAQTHQDIELIVVDDMRWLFHAFRVTLVPSILLNGFITIRLLMRKKPAARKRAFSPWRAR